MSSVGIFDVTGTSVETESWTLPEIEQAIEDGDRRTITVVNKRTNQDVLIVLDKITAVKNYED